MSESRTPNPNTIEALERVIREIRYLVDHPRIQQRTWVASGKEWLPLLHIIHGELTGNSGEAAVATPPDDGETLLVRVNMSTGTNYAQIRLNDIDRIQVNDRRSSGSITLKNGRQYLTSADEAQRVVDVLRKHDDPAPSEPPT